MSGGILLSDLLRNARLVLSNHLRRMRWRQLDYVVLRISGHYPERTVRRRRRFPLSLLPWPPPPPSVDSFALALERIAADPRVKGAVLIVSGLSAGLATLGSLRTSILRLRQAGKQCIAYAHELNTWSYYLASACDEILAPESATFRAAGLWAEAVFLKDTLALADRARCLAELSPRRHAPLLDVLTPKHYCLAQTSSVEVGAWLDGLRSLLREGVYALAPWSIRFRG